MHAIERLRWVAGTRWAPAGDLAAEAAWALAELAEEEPLAVLPACRRLLDRHPGCGPLWWVAASVLTAPDPAEAAADCGDKLADDPTEDRLDDAVPAGRRVVRRGSLSDVAGAELVLVTVDAIGAGGVVVDDSAVGLLTAATELRVPVWAVAGVGRVLPSRLWSALEGRLTGAPGRSPGCLAGLGAIERVAGPDGTVPLDRALAAPSCPEPPELLGGSGPPAPRPAGW